MPILFITSSPNYNFILNDYYKLILIISISKGDLQQRILSCFGAVHRNVENIWTLNARTMTPVYNTNSRGNILAQMKYEGTYEHIRCYQCSCPSCRNTWHPLLVNAGADLKLFPHMMINLVMGCRHNRNISDTYFQHLSYPLDSLT